MSSWTDFERSPSVRRTLTNLRCARQRGELAVLLGAGADGGLCHDAGQPSVNWTALMESLATSDGVHSKEKVHEQWPTEMASVYRGFLGESGYRDAIANATNVTYNPKLAKRYTRSLAGVLASTNLIITLNYTDSAKQLLDAWFAHAGVSGKQVVILDREDLPSFQFPAPEHKPRRIYVVHLHGRVAPLSEPVLDAWGYNVVHNEDPHYRQILRRTFEQRFVLTVGISWADMPLRNEAAYVRRTRGFAAVDHLMLQYHAGDAATLAKVLEEYVPPNPRSVWVKAMASSYNLTVQPTSASEIPNILNAVTRDLVAPTADVNELAEFLEETGDFESVEQHRLFRGSSGRQLRRLTELCDACETYAAQSNDWTKLAKVEKHLRHHLYLYGRRLPDRISGGKEVAPREWLVRLVHERGKQSRRNLDPALAFDILMGLAEVLPNDALFKGLQPGDDLHWSTFVSPYQAHVRRLVAQVATHPVYTERLRFVPWVWCKTRAKSPPDDALVRELLTLGCESLAAKLVLDAADDLAVRESLARVPNPDHISQIRAYAQRSGQIARAVGHRRREVKAHVFQAMWSESPRDGRLLILGDSLAQASHQLESPLLDGMALSLVTCHVASVLARQPWYGGDKEEFERGVIAAAGLPKWDRANVQNYWIKRCPFSCRSAISCAMGMRN